MSVNKSKYVFLLVSFSILLVFNLNIFLTKPLPIEAQQPVYKENNGPPFNGVDMHGYYTRTSQARDVDNDLPPNYFEESFKILSSSGMNHDSIASWKIVGSSLYTGVIMLYLWRCSSLQLLMG